MSGATAPGPESPTAQALILGGAAVGFGALLYLAILADEALSRWLRRRRR